MTFDNVEDQSSWEQEHLDFQSRFEWLDEWPQEDELEF